MKYKENSLFFNSFIKNFSKFMIFYIDFVFIEI